MRLDDASTWPDSVAEWTHDHIGSLTDSFTDYDFEDEFRRLLVGHRVRAFHATRLLDHEVVPLIEDGLQPLTETLIQRRLDDARTHGYITSEEREVLRSANVFAVGGERHRENQVCVFLSTRPLERGGWGLRAPMNIWGGEGMYMSAPGQAQEPRLRQLGRPAIVACDVDLGSGADFRTHPPLWSAFTRQRRGDEDYGSTVHYRASVPVVAVWRSGDGEYDQFHGLPADEGAPPRG